MQINRKYLELLSESKLMRNVMLKSYKNQLFEKEAILKFKKGELLFQNQKGIMILLKGEVELKNKGLTLRKYEKSEILGTSLAFNKNRDTILSITASRNSIALLIDEAKMKRLFTTDEAILENYLELVSEDFAFLARRIHNFTAGSAEAKLSLYLLEHIQEEGGERIVFLPNSLTQFALMLDLGRASLYRALEHLENNFIIFRNKKQIKVLDVARLEKMCN